jgi:putative transposase
MDEQYMKTPFFGSRRMTATLNKIGYQVNRKRVRRLMGLMGIEAVYRKPRTSKPAPENKIYPYLLRGLCIDHPDQVWASDITYSAPRPSMDWGAYDRNARKHKEVMITKSALRLRCCKCMSPSGGDLLSTGRVT